VELEEEEKIETLQPKINMDSCDLCGECAEACRFNAIVITPNGPMIFPELCRSCGACAIACPKDAISESPKTVGKVEKGEGELDFYQGVLTTGELLAPLVIKAVKENAEDGKDVVIDVPPGNACSSVEAIGGADFCILVTEPTPFGLHDLKLSVRMLRDTEIPFGVVVNRDGIGDRRVEDYCEEEGIPIMMKIENDQKIAELYSEGIPFVKEMPEWKERFVELYEDIKEMVK